MTFILSGCSTPLPDHFRLQNNTPCNISRDQYLYNTKTNDWKDVRLFGRGNALLWTLKYLLMTCVALITRFNNKNNVTVNWMNIVNKRMTSWSICIIPTLYKRYINCFYVSFAALHASVQVSRRLVKCGVSTSRFGTWTNPLSAVHGGPAKTRWTTSATTPSIRILISRFAVPYVVHWKHFNSWTAYLQALMTSLPGWDHFPVGQHAKFRKITIRRTENCVQLFKTTWQEWVENTEMFPA
jgi:hypothetical protein